MRSTRLRFAILAAACVAAAASRSASIAAEPPDPCRAAAGDVLRSCRTGAQSDFWLASALCDNTSDRVSRRTCNGEAAADLREELDGCREQFEARGQTCRRLGGGAYDPIIDPADFVDRIDNPFLPLTPGTTFVYEAHTEDGFETVVVAVTRKTRTILGVTCIEVHDVETRNGEVIEDTLDWFAQDREGNVWYFGENSKRLDGGLVVGVDGSWTAGVDGAKPGIIMKAHPAAGDFYRQEFDLGNAEDQGEVIRLSSAVAVPFGVFDGCVETEDTSALEPDALERKFYARGVGLVLEVDPESGERVELVGIIHEYAGYPYFDPPRVEALASPDELGFGIAPTCHRERTGEPSLFRMARRSYLALPNASVPGAELGAVMHF